MLYLSWIRKDLVYKLIYVIQVFFILCVYFILKDWIE